MVSIHLREIDLKICALTTLLFVNLLRVITHYFNDLVCLGRKPFNNQQFPYWSHKRQAE